MTNRTTEPQPTRRRRIPPAWLVLLAGLAFFLTAGIRYVGESARSWEVQASIGSVFILAGLFIAVIRRGIR